MVFKFLLFGPLVGSLLFGVILNVISLAVGRTDGELLAVIFLGIPIGYLVGSIPAILTGMCVSHFKRKKPGVNLIKISFFIGLINCLITVLVVSVIFGLSDLEGLIRTLIIGLFLGLIGGISAAIVAKYQL